MQKYSKLFTPYKIGKLEIKNRYVMGPMAPFGLADAMGALNERGVEYYVERARGDVGLIITGASAVDLGIEGFVKPSVLCPTDSPAAFIQSGKVFTERLHSYGAKVFFQLSGGFGRVGMPHIFSRRVAPSDSENRWVTGIEHKAMTTEEVESMIKKFAASAAICQKTGYDGVEIHAVHEGYLLDQFAMALFNKRTDRFGGGLEGRLRLATEIVQAIKAVCGPDFPVILRFSLKSYMKGLRQGAVPGEEFEEIGRDTEEGLQAARILTDAGYDALDVDAGTYDSWYWNHPPMYFEDGMYLQFSRKIREEMPDITLITAGRLDDPDLALKAIEDGDTDFISLARPLLADPMIVKKIKTGKLDRIRPCLSCHEACIGRIEKGSPISCAVNPACCREKEYGLTPSMEKKKIAIAGGGLAGMEFARVAILRGHDVTLYEKSDKLGGNIIPGGAPDFKRHDKKLLAWYENELKLLNAKIEFNTALTRELVDETNPDVVVVATGSKPIQITLPGTEGKTVYSAEDILMDNEKAGKKVTIVGGGQVGCELALQLVKNGREVTVVEMAELMGGPHNLPFPNYDMLKDLLYFNKVKIMTQTKVTGVEGDAVAVEHDGQKELIDTDTLVVAVGYRPETGLMSELEDCGADLYQIGDSRKVHNIMSAIWDAYEVARGI